MKNKIATTIVCLAAFCAQADAPTGNYLTWLGNGAAQDSTADYTTFLGGLSGNSSSDILKTSFLGVMCGFGSQYLDGVFAEGYRAAENAGRMKDVYGIGTSSLRDSYGLTNAFFVGASAGRGLTNRTDVIDILGMVKVNGASGDFAVGSRDDPAASMTSGKMTIRADMLDMTVGREDVDAEEAKAGTVGARVYLSANRGTDTNTGRTFASPVKTIAKAIIVATNYAASAGYDNKEIVVAVCEGRYSGAKFNTTATHGIRFVAVGAKCRTRLVGGENATDRFVPFDNCKVTSDSYLHATAGNPIAFEGFRISGFRGQAQNGYTKHPFYGIDFYDCDVTDNDMTVYKGLHWFCTCNLTRCRVSGNRLTSSDPAAALYAVFAYGTLRDCVVTDNDFSYFMYFGMEATFRRCLIVNDFCDCRFGGGYDTTIVCDQFDNPMIAGNLPSDGFSKSNFGNCFMVVKDGQFVHHKNASTHIYHGYGIVTNATGVAWVASSNATLTADYVAADIDCISVRSDGSPDYGYKTSTFSALKYAYTKSQADALLATKTDATDFNQLAGSVDAMSAHLNAEDARFVSTNYDSVVRVPEAYVEIKINNSWRTIWREMTRWTNWTGSAWNWTGWQGFHAWSTNVTAQLSRKAERCWGIYDSETGEVSPDGWTQISSSNILIAANMSYKRVVDTANAVWVLECNQGTATFGGDTNGYFRVKDGDGNTQFEIVKGNQRELGADAGGITVTQSGGNNVMTILYSVVANNHPTLKICTNLSTANWITEGSAGCAGTVVWSGSSGAYVATVTVPAATPAAFVKATYLGGSETVINNVAPTKMQFIYIGNTKYAIGYATISGTGVMTLTPQ